MSGSALGASLDLPLDGYYSAAPSRAEPLRECRQVSRLELPALDPSTVTEIRGSGYPEPFKSRMGDRIKRRLGEACGLTKFGVNLVSLPAGGQSALRHWHTLEDEFVYVLSGEVTLITDAGEQTLGPDMCAGYPAGKRDAHHFINRGGEPAIYLEIGSRIPGDSSFYPDDDLMWCDDGAGEYGAHKDGRRYVD
jgi:uncharacterized cupin superfamily protein